MVPEIMKTNGRNCDIDYGKVVAKVKSVPPFRPEFRFVGGQMGLLKEVVFKIAWV